jgi:tight adherence protein C
MDFNELLPYLIFAAFTVGAWAVMSLLSSKESRASERLEELKDPSRRNRGAKGGENEKGVGAMLKKAAPKLSKALQPKTELEQNALKVRLANAGFNSPAAPQLYLAIKLAALVVGLMAGGGYGFLSFGMTQNGLTSLIVGGGLGFYLPEIILRLTIKSRQERIFLGLPDTLDLLVVCVEAGLGLDAGMRKVAEELNDTHPDVCKEFHLANMQLQMGRARRDVLHDLGVRTGVDDMRALVAILIQADKFGSSIAQALRVQSDSMRTKRRQIAEERAQQTAVKLIFPLVLFIFPGIFVVLVGPAALMMINGLFAQ